MTGCESPVNPQNITYIQEKTTDYANPTAAQLLHSFSKKTYSSADHHAVVTFNYQRDAITHTVTARTEAYCEAKQGPVNAELTLALGSIGVDTFSNGHKTIAQRMLAAPSIETGGSFLRLTNTFSFSSGGDTTTLRISYPDTSRDSYANVCKLLFTQNDALFKQAEQSFAVDNMSNSGSVTGYVDNDDAAQQIITDAQNGVTITNMNGIVKHQ